jgi:hypothetical protein
MVACSNQARGAIPLQRQTNEAARLRATRPLRRGVFVSAIGTTPPLINSSFAGSLQRGVSGVSSRDSYPSIDAIRLALPPAAVVSMQVTRSVAKRAT